MASQQERDRRFRALRAMMEEQGIAALILGGNAEATQRGYVRYTADWRLSSDTIDDPELPGGYSAHGDWFDGWDAGVRDAWIRGCVQAAADCHAHLVGDGRAMY